jgi:protein-S-isoprenylcysteine O-methyltransferase Ste14
MPDAVSLKTPFAYRQSLPITILALFAGWLACLFSTPYFKEHSSLEHGLDLIAWFILALGIAIRGWSSREISGRKKTAVVCTGPYALCRNPLYWGTFFIALSQLAFLRTIAFGVIMLIPIALYILGVVPAEERYFTWALGVEYRDYCGRPPVGGHAGVPKYSGARANPSLCPISVSWSRSDVG